MAKRADHERTDRPRYRAQLGFVLASAAFAAIFVAVALAAFHAPAPHDLPVGIVAPPAVTGHLENALAHGGQDSFALRSYRSQPRARTAVTRGDIDGALIATNAGLRLLIAQAGGTGPEQAVTGIFSAFAAKAHEPLTVVDVVAARPGDTEALSPFFIVLGVLIPSLAAGSASALVFRRSRRVWCVAAPVAVAVVIGLIAAAIADGITGLGDYAAIAGIVALFSLAVSAPTAVLGRLWPPLVSVAVLAFIVLGIPASGGPASLGQFGPAFLRALHPALPLGAAADAVRGAVYFDGNGTTVPLEALAAWAGVGLLGLILVVTFRRQAPAGLPAPATATPESGPVLSALTSGTVARASVVVGFDNSVPARRALAWTARLAATRPVSLRVVYADHAGIDSDLSGFAHAELTRARDQAAAAIERAAAEIIGRSDVAYTFGRRPGPPADAILAEANAAQAADGPSADSPVIVVGRSGHVVRHVLGSVPMRLLHHSPYPVLAVS